MLNPPAFEYLQNHITLNMHNYLPNNVLLDSVFVANIKNALFYC